MAHDTHFDPTLVRQTIGLAEELEIARLADKGDLPAARERFVQFVENLTTREVHMLTGVMMVGAGTAPDLEAGVESLAGKYDAKPVLAIKMADDESLTTHLNAGLKNLLVAAPEV